MIDSDSSSSSGPPEEPPAAEPIMCFSPDEEDQVTPAGPEVSDEDLRVDPLKEAFVWLEQHLGGNDCEAHERILDFADTVIRAQLRRDNPETLDLIRSMVEDIQVQLSIHHPELFAKHDEGWVIRHFAEPICEAVADEVISELKQMKGDCLLSGDDSPLKNTWEEVCVQVQGDESVYWDAYETTVRTMIAQHVNGMAEHERLAIWYQTEDRQEWWLESVEDREVEAPVDDGAVISHIEKIVYSKAEDFSNENIVAWDEHR